MYLNKIYYLKKTLKILYNLQYILGVLLLLDLLNNLNIKKSKQKYVIISHIEIELL